MMGNEKSLLTLGPLLNLKYFQLLQKFTKQVTSVQLLYPFYLYFDDKVILFSGLQIYYLSSVNVDGTDDDCESLGWKRLQEYNPAQRRWKYLNDLAGGKVVQEETLLFEDELQDEDYFPSLPFAAMFTFFKVIS